MEEFLQKFGYFASYLGGFIEGEILLVTTVVTAKMGYMNVVGALAAVFAGAYTRDWATFLIARKKGKAKIENNPRLKAKLDKVNLKLQKNPNLLLITYRLIYGLSTMIVIMIGIGHVSMKRFGVLSAVSNMLWVLVYGSLGYFFADAVLENVNWINDHKTTAIAFLAIAGVLYWLFVQSKELSIFQTND